MPNNHYHHLVFGPRTLARQRATGSYTAYGSEMERGDDGPPELSGREIAMLTDAFQIHLATVAETGWPYVQYRSGPRGFIHHLGGSRFGFADHHGNSQFTSLANIDTDGRVAIFVADFPMRTRLKLYGRAQVIDAAADPDLHAMLMTVADGRMTARSERSIVIDIEAFDWNCSRSIVPQYDREYVKELNVAHAEQLRALQEEIDSLRARLKS